MSESDKFLNLLTRHTNLEKPYSDYVKADSFPEQISELLNTEVTIKYRNHYIADISIAEKAALITRNGESISSRPSDDEQQLDPRELPESEEEESPFVFSGKFKVLRADKAEPYRLIAISTDNSIIVVNSTKTVNGDYAFKTHISEYPSQIKEYIGLTWYDQYSYGKTEIKAVTLRVDATEPCYSVLAEYVDDTTCRYVLGDEVKSKLYVNSSNVMTTNISNFRKSIVEGMTIYGTV